MLHARMLNYLDEVARCGSMRLAGERLNVAASAINRQIIALENRLGTPIFHRHPRQLTLTSAGEVLMKHVRMTLRDMERTRAQIDEIRGLKRGEISLAVVSGLAGAIAPRIASRFREDHPNVKFRIRMCSAKEAPVQVARGDADIGLGFELRADDDVDIAFSAPSRIGAVFGPDHPLAEHKKVTLAQCLHYPVCIADKDMVIRAQLERVAQMSQLTIDPILETNSVETMRRMATSDGCITFISIFDMSEERTNGTLVYRPLDEPELPTEAIVAIRRRTQTNPLTPSVVDLIARVLREWGGR